jgi:selenide,water dikinase
VSQERLLKLLEGFGKGKIGMDCSMIPSKRYKDLYQISTTDFFFPLVDDPYLMGRIACCNVLSDLYAEGVEHCDNMLMLLSTCRGMTLEENDIVMKLVIKGFNECALEAETEVTGGQTVQNEWMIIGGVAISLCKEEDMIRPVNAKDGDVIILTKPLGTQIAGNAHEWLYKEGMGHRLDGVVTKEEILVAYDHACKSMSTLNKESARLMKKHKAHCATDITGFGITGHAVNLAGNQLENVDFEIHTLPIIKNMAKVDKHVNIWKLEKGYSSETSGGLFICLDKENVEGFCKDFEESYGYQCWIIGNVVKGTKTAKIIEDYKIIEV